MSHAGTATWLALRELWMTFRLVVLLVALVGGGVAVSLLPAPVSAVLDRLAIGLAAATMLAASLAAWSIAADRRHGRAGWLVSRSVSRGSVLGGWFVAVGAVVVAGVAAASLLGWFAGATVARVDLANWAAASASVAATGLAAVALGCAVGLLLGPWPASIVAAVVSAASIGAAWLLPVGTGWIPGHAFVALAAAEGGASTAASARDGGVALVVTAALLAVGRGIAERVEL